MSRRVISLVVVVVLVGLAIGAEVELGRIPRTDPLGRELLYLPTPEMLRIVSVGNPGLAADVLYLWSIQYYSLFEPHERFLYLETIYNLITDLDPLYFDAYRIGALIMEIQTGGDQRELQKAVVRLFDKGIKNLPESWELAETAAWDMYMRFHDREEALRYAEIAAGRPGAPARIKRMVGVWHDSESSWTVDDSIAYWRRAADEAVDPFDRRICLSKLYDAVATKDKEQLQPLLAAQASRAGRCPDDWQSLIRNGLLRQVPLDLFGNPYGIDPVKCRVVAHKQIRDQ